jgi:UDP-glucose 4-epimerase
MTSSGPGGGSRARTVLLTGATGYIASHTWLALQAAGFAVVGIDNLSNSSLAVLPRLEELSGAKPDFVRADVCDEAALDAVFASRSIDAVVHFAALKAVGESVRKPLEYYANNVGGLVTLLRAMRRHGCSVCVFSSSATVYGDPEQLPIKEDARLAAVNPYGSTKLMCERVLADMVVADGQLQVACLRYFNPVGAHESGLLGEDPRGIPNNLMPYVAQVAVGRRPQLRVFGGDWPTADGTGVRDYIHVVDLAEGHVRTLEHLLSRAGSVTLNLGTGRGHSVLDVIRAFERASGREVPFEIVARRGGDVAACYADPAQAERVLGWRATRDLDAMCRDAWRWQDLNPRGYED